MQRRQRSWSMATAVAALVLAGASIAATPQAPPSAPAARMAEAQRLEGQAMLSLADAAMAIAAGAASATPADFTIRWQNEFLKAQQGTFVPFTLAIGATGSMPPAALVYVRAVPRGTAAAERDDRGERRDRRKARFEAYPVDAIFPVELDTDSAGIARVSRGFSIAPGTYDIYVVVRERAPAASRAGTARAAVLATALDVPDFWTGELATSSIIVADRLRALSEPVTVDELPERPYAIGQNEIVPAADRRFRRDEALIVVLLVYNPTVTPEKRFDLEVEYHFFQAAAPGQPGPLVAAGAGIPPLRKGERYFNRTEPQRFNPALMGSAFDPTAGHPVLAGQEIPLAGFDEGEYRLAIRVTDMLSGKFVLRDVHFTVGS